MTDLKYTGDETLEALRKATRFTEWMYQTIRPHCSGKVLEVGSGTGNISRFFLRDGYEIQLSDVEQVYCDNLQQTFGHEPKLLGTVCLDLVAPDFDTRYADYLGKFDTVFALNVIEHIENDVLALSNIRKLLAPKGKFVGLVPAYQWLFSPLDTALGHYRRYTKPRFRAVFQKANYQVVHEQHYNFMGIFGWLVVAKMMRRTQISENQAGFYDKLVPLWKVLDWLVLRLAGVSVITVGQKVD